jgi:hypothetical protein
MPIISSPANYRVPDTPVETPFENIAIAFSGGGFRAASFALGTLSYFNELKLENGTQVLENVSYISSASGGTIASALYALYNAQGKHFGEYYKDLLGKLEGTDLLREVFKILNDKSEWVKRKPKTRNLINAFAIAYDQFMFSGATVAAVGHSTTTHLDEVCFNATEFYRGLLFRQSIKMKPDVKETMDKNDFLYGNFIIHLSREAASGLRLGDIVAASSCFPAGFEPIIFPVDFETNTNGFLLKHLSIELQKLSRNELDLLYGKERVGKILEQLPKPFSLDDLKNAFSPLPLQQQLKIGLMDGGITDNQGIESMVRANSRRLSGQTSFKPFDLMFVNDVGSQYMLPYQFPDDMKNDTGFQSLSVGLVFAAAFITALLGAGLLIAIFFSTSHLLNLSLGFFGTLFLFAGAAVISVLLYIKKFISSKLKGGKGLDLDKNFSEEITGSLFHFLKSTPVGVIFYMLKQRMNSVLTLNSDVFLKRIRYLLYQRFFSTNNLGFRVKSNHVYDLSYTNDLNFSERDSPNLKPGRNIQIVAELAFEMGTTLWFDSRNQKQHSEAALIACGQFTTCFNLLEYIQRLKASTVFDNLSEYYKIRVNKLEANLQSDYAAFDRDPFWLYNQSGKRYHIEKFTDCTMDTLDFNLKNYKGLRNW